MTGLSLGLLCNNTSRTEQQLMKNTPSVQWEYGFEDWHSYKVYIKLKFLPTKRFFRPITGTSQIMLFVEIPTAWYANL
jgi:hypothetical protein